MRIGSDRQNKVIDALSQGLPVLTNSWVRESFYELSEYGLSEKSEIDDVIMSLESDGFDNLIRGIDKKYVSKSKAARKLYENYMRYVGIKKKEFSSFIEEF